MLRIEMQINFNIEYPIEECIDRAEVLELGQNWEGTKVLCEPVLSGVTREHTT